MIRWMRAICTKYTIEATTSTAMIVSTPAVLICSKAYSASAAKGASTENASKARSPAFPLMAALRSSP